MADAQKERLLEELKVLVLRVSKLAIDINAGLPVECADEAFWKTAAKSASEIDGAVRELRAFVFAGTKQSGAAHIDPEVEQGLN